MKLLIIPADPAKNRNRYFDLSDTPDNRDMINRPITILRERLQQAGHTFDTIDMGDPNEADLIIDCSPTFRYWRKAFKEGWSDKMIYYAGEPEVVIPYHSSEKLKKILRGYRYIITWNDDVINDETIFRVPPGLGFCFEEIRNTIPFEEKKLLVNISGCKQSSHPNELYSERVKVIRYYDSRHPDDFDQYGDEGWKATGIECYRGRCANKAKTYHQYKFALSLENGKNVRGDVTEKLFDCFNAGIVPIYAGVDNIDDYVPKSCYIDYMRFDSLDEMDTYLRNMPCEEYCAYLDAIHRFVHSDKTKPFEAEYTAAQIMKIIKKERTRPRKMPKWKQLLFILTVLWWKVENRWDAIRRMRRQ